MSRALRRIVEARPGLLVTGERIRAAGRARTVSGTETAGRFPPTTIWAVSDRRLFVFDATRPRRRGLDEPVAVYDLATAVDGSRTEPFDHRDALVTVAFDGGVASIVMDPDEARAIVAAIDAGLAYSGTAGTNRAAAGPTDMVSPAGPVGAGSPVGSVGDTRLDDASITAMRSALVAGDTDRARGVFSDLPTNASREWVVRHLVGPELTGGVEAWVAAAPDDADAYLVRGAIAVGNAFSEPNATTFHDDLRFAEQNLWWAVELAFDDPVPFAPLIRSGGGLSIPAEELTLRFREADRREQGLVGAHLETVVALGADRSGSLEQMYAFVSEAGDRLPDGSPAHAMVALAHLIALDRGAAATPHRRVLPADALGDVDLAIAMSVASARWTPGPGSAETFNILAAALASGGEAERAAQMLRGVGSVRTRLPWALLSNGEELYGSVASAIR